MANSVGKVQILHKVCTFFFLMSHFWKAATANLVCKCWAFTIYSTTRLSSCSWEMGDDGAAAVRS